MRSVNEESGRSRISPFLCMCVPNATKQTITFTGTSRYHISYVCVCLPMCSGSVWTAQTLPANLFQSKPLGLVGSDKREIPLIGERAKRARHL